MNAPIRPIALLIGFMAVTVAAPSSAQSTIGDSDMVLTARILHEGFEPAVEVSGSTLKGVMASPSGDPDGQGSKQHLHVWLPRGLPIDGKRLCIALNSRDGQYTSQLEVLLEEAPSLGAILATNKSLRADFTTGEPDYYNQYAQTPPPHRLAVLAELKDECRPTVRRDAVLATAWHPFAPNSPPTTLTVLVNANRLEALLAVWVKDSDAQPKQQGIPCTPIDATPSEATPAALLRPMLATANAMGSAPCAEPHQSVALQRLTLEASIDRQPLNGALQGRGRIGGAPYFTNLAESPPLLRHGQAVVMGRRLLSERAYPLMETPLYLGDTVRVIDVKERGTNPAPAAQQSGAEQVPPDAATSVLTCLFSVEGEAMDGSGIEVACHARGQALAIGRYGDRSREDLAPRPWDVLINEPSMQATLPLAITGLFILVIRLLDMLYPFLCRRLARVGDVRGR